MQHIADTLNISKNSVSQALSGKGGVSEETRKLIAETAFQMGYIYPQGRVNKMNDRTGCIGLIASDYAFAQKNFFGEIYLEIEQEVAKRGMNLRIQSIHQEAIDRLSLPRFLEDQQIEGILILSHLSTEYINTVIKTGIPTVLIDHHHPNIQADCILTNNRFGAYDAVQHLMDLGHREIGFAGNIRYSPSYYERLEGYRMALEDHHLELNPDFIIKDAKEEMDAVLRQLSRMKQQPTAWFCVNDALGFLFNSGLQQFGMKVPEEVSVCSFDNGQLSRMATPTTTSIEVNLKFYGIKAVEQLFWRIEHRGQPFMEILLPTTLIQRESTGVCNRVGQLV
ncbi:LacI family DNA-binding transcriptional regulator [Paenibacillus selenitireducens]|nr:LacI family DNA-binding transcriptional regulator [Paenibacillus selenitireducens]